MAEEGRLVAADYDSSVESTAEIASVEGTQAMEIQIDSHSSSSSQSSSIYVLTDEGESGDAEHWVSDDSTLSSGSLSIVVGGAGRVRRVQHESVVVAATERMKNDLSTTPQGLLVEHKCVAHIIRADAHAAKAIFQAQTVKQRYVAFSASLARAGLTDFAKGISHAAEQMGNDDIPEHAAVTTSQPEATSDPYIDVPMKKRGRPKKDENEAAQQPSKAKQADGEGEQQVDPAHVHTLVTKIAQLERWAHGVDRTIASTGSGSSAAEKNDTTVCKEHEIPPTIDYEPQDEQGIVPRRVAEFEKLSLVQGDSGASAVSKRLTRVENVIKDFATRFVDDPAVMFKELNANVDKLNAFATAASEQLQRSRLFDVGAPLPPQFESCQQPERHLGWRIYMLEKSLHEHIEIVQGIHDKYISETKEAQVRLQRQQMELETLRKQCAKHDQLLNVLMPWMASIATKVQETPLQQAPSMQTAQPPAAAALQQLLQHSAMAAYGNGAPQSYPWPQTPMFTVPMQPSRQLTPMAPLAPLMPTPAQFMGASGHCPH
eukprot:2770907-Amphidinium_carterae.4